MNFDYEKCIECGKCTRNCLFLDKYDMNLKGYAARSDLSYNCYLCGECRRVCPVDIDGRELSLNLREKRIEEGDNPYLKGYVALILEKRNYIFKNYRNTKEGSVFFPGCNFPAYYPETTKLISKKLKDEFSIPTVFDCCGKPIADLSMKDEEKTLSDRLESRLDKHGIEELIVLCPNCYYYFKNNSDIKVSLIYEHEDIMKSLIDWENFEKIKGLIYLPCPDRDERIIYNLLTKYIDKENIKEIRGIQCCGAGGCASVKEKELTHYMQEEFKKYGEKIHLYCATCSGMISKSDSQTEHILCSLLGSGEQVSKGLHSLKNRALFSLKK